MGVPWTLLLSIFTTTFSIFNSLYFHDDGSLCGVRFYGDFGSSGRGGSLPSCNN
jgi:hypothetical protein